MSDKEFCQQRAQPMITNINVIWRQHNVNSNITILLLRVFYYQK